MIWAVSLDDEQSTSLSSTDPNVKMLLSYMCLDPRGCPGQNGQPNSRSVLQQSEGESACYTSFCNAGCAVGYTEVSTMNGLIGYLNFDNTCNNGEYQSLCCADGTTYGTCSWQGYTGLGLSCSGGCAGALGNDVSINILTLVIFCPWIARGMVQHHGLGSFPLAGHSDLPFQNDIC